MEAYSKSLGLTKQWRPIPRVYASPNLSTFSATSQVETLQRRGLQQCKLNAVPYIVPYKLAYNVPYKLSYTLTYKLAYNVPYKLAYTVAYNLAYKVSTVLDTQPGAA